MMYEYFHEIFPLQRNDWCQIGVQHAETNEIDVQQAETNSQKMFFHEAGVQICLENQLKEEVLMAVACI